MSLTTQERYRTLSNRAKFGAAAPFLNAQRADRLRSLLADPPMRTNQRWNEVLARDPAYVPHGPPDPFVVPETYDEESGDPDVVGNINEDVMSAVDFAFRWVVDAEEAAGEAAVRILESWSTLQEFGTNFQEALTGSNRFTMLIQAAYMVQDRADFTPTIRSEFDRVTRMFMENTRAYVSETNHAAWGLSMLLAGAGWLGDRDLFDKAIFRWRMLLDDALVDDEPHRELYRQGGGSSYGGTGLFYSTFFLNGMAQAAEWARVNGEWIYDHVTPDGSSLKGLWEKVAYWTRHPHLYPYNSNGQGLAPMTKPVTPTPSGTVRIQGCFDHLHALWPNADSQYCIDRWTTTQDYIGFRNGLLIYRYLPLWDK